MERLSTAAVGQQSVYNFILQEDSEFLEETVVIGYGVQRKSDLTGAGKINSKLTFEDVMEEKQYEMWFGSCRFLDIVRWSKQGKVNLDQLFNKSGLHQNATTVYDAFFTKGEAEHRLYTEPCSLKFNDFVVGKNEYFPFPRDYKNANPNLHDVLGWATE